MRIPWYKQMDTRITMIMQPAWGNVITRSFPAGRLILRRLTHQVTRAKDRHDSTTGAPASPHPFCHHDGSRILRIDRSFHSALKRANIDEFRFHDLRHTFGSHLTMRGVPLETIGALLGHNDPKMTKRYAHLSPASWKEAVSTLQDLR